MTETPKMSAREVIQLLNLQPHPAEGGWFAETYRSADEIAKNALPERYSGPRNCSTCIYYLLDENSVSKLHVLTSDEFFHFYLGDPVEMLMLYEDGRSEIIELGPDIRSGQRVQHLVPRGVWQGSRLKPGGSFALLGTTVAPGFDFADFRLSEEDLSLRFPQHRELIKALT